MYYVNDLTAGPEFDRQRLFDEVAELFDAEREREIQACLDELQVLADNPQLRHRRGYVRVSAALPFADSRRPTDPNDTTRRWVMDNGFSARDAERNARVRIDQRVAVSRAWVPQRQPFRQPKGSGRPPSIPAEPPAAPVTARLAPRDGAPIGCMRTHMAQGHGAQLSKEGGAMEEADTAEATEAAEQEERITFIGVLMAEPVLDYNSNGKAYTKLRVKVEREDGSREYRTVVAWNKVALACAEWLHRDRKVEVTGVEREYDYTDDYGVKHDVRQVSALRVGFIDRKPVEREVAAQ
jgi:hypothetical protein